MPASGSGRGRGGGSSGPGEPAGTARRPKGVPAQDPRRAQTTLRRLTLIESALRRRFVRLEAAIASNSVPIERRPAEHFSALLSDLAGLARRCTDSDVAAAVLRVNHHPPMVAWSLDGG